MSRVLYIEASPRKSRSTSIQVAHVFLEEYRKKHPNDEIEVLDLWQLKLPRFDGDVIEAKYAIMHKQAHSEAQRKAWRAVEDVIDDFKKADKYVISLPMWNFGIPYKLKHFIDVIVQPGYTFSVTPEEGYKGMVVGKPMAVFYARGGAYGAGTGGESLDFQKTYLDTLLKFIGFTDIHSIVTEPTLADPALKEKAIVNGSKEARELADRF